MNLVNLESLPEDLQASIRAFQDKTETPLFPIAPRQFDPSFATREVKELCEKVDLLIRAANELHEALSPTPLAPKPKK